MSSDLDKVFEQLKRDGKNNLDNIMKWLKDAKIINEGFTEEQARKLFEGAENGKIELEKFNEAMSKIAEEKKENLEHIQKQMVDESKKIFGALKAGMKAFRDSLKK